MRIMAMRTAFVRMAMIRIMLRRLVPKPSA